MFSTTDEPHSEDSMSSSPTPILSPNSSKEAALKHAEKSSHSAGILASENTLTEEVLDDDEMASEPSEIGPRLEESLVRLINDADDDDDDERMTTDDEDEEELDKGKFQPEIPTILPRKRYVGARNVATVKDGNVPLHVLPVFL